MTPTFFACSLVFVDFNNPREPTVYVADPSSRDRALVIDTLGRLGHRVVGETELGLRVLADLDVKPDLVVIDPAMPDTSGFSLLSQIRRADRRTSVVVVSRLENLPFVSACFHHGAAAFVAKRELAVLGEAIDVVRKGKRFVSREQMSRLLRRARRSRPETPFHRATRNQVGAAVTAALGYNAAESASATAQTRRSVEGSRRRLSESLGVVDSDEIGLLARMYLSGGPHRLPRPAILAATPTRVPRTRLPA